MEADRLAASPLIKDTARTVLAIDHRQGTIDADGPLLLIPTALRAVAPTLIVLKPCQIIAAPPGDRLTAAEPGVAGTLPGIRPRADGAAARTRTVAPFSRLREAGVETPAPLAVRPPAPSTRATAARWGVTLGGALALHAGLALALWLPAPAPEPAAAGIGSIEVTLVFGYAGGEAGPGAAAPGGPTGGGAIALVPMETVEAAEVEAAAPVEGIDTAEQTPIDHSIEPETSVENVEMVETVETAEVFPADEAKTIEPAVDEAPEPAEPSVAASAEPAEVTTAEEIERVETIEPAAQTPLVAPPEVAVQRTPTPPPPKPARQAKVEPEPQSKPRVTASAPPQRLAAAEAPGSTTIRPTRVSQGVPGNAAGTTALAIGGDGRAGAAGQGTGDNAVPPGGGAGGMAGSSADYIAILQAWLDRYKDYPRRARLRGQEGTVLLYLMIDDEGRVLDHRVERSAGFALLDAAAKEMVERAQPLPRAPDGLGTKRLELVVPVRFFLR